jgi:hypothetical protein
LNGTKLEPKFKTLINKLINSFIERWNKENENIMDKLDDIVK